MDLKRNRSSSPPDRLAWEASLTVRSSAARRRWAASSATSTYLRGRPAHFMIDESLPKGRQAPLVAKCPSQSIHPLD
ncbi:hypothetical protein I545_2315 [Mycobacterium kansasii 662]|uniref:Uncharacterized protein n=2 Tax=Mycobacterium kansasii TaxID=1768 RepID=A0A1V3XM34_MYCKA|nr:hypothetical protein I547_4188 [Mycobacterium kansasii 824]EUA20323.1 hypothetical protein I545_2315 [Mycobacterium kansasii 662]KEP40251.1 hypothetical protein MKSMC1_45950 [Mycobacterium kansasii]OOK79525.1 hypothetical protein BZL30_1857 [Mycobacterium kansasii]OOK80168.1 hypothetical protein BZL29_1908 [Mycobacterium kansasii]